VCGGSRTEEDLTEAICKGCRHAAGGKKNKDSGGRLGEGKFDGCPETAGLMP
jgi:hypothetical protein